VKLREHRIAAKDTCQVALSTGVEPAVKGASTSEAGITLGLIWHSQMLES